MDDPRGGGPWSEAYADLVEPTSIDDEIPF